MSPAIYLGKAERSLSAAQLLLQAGDTEGACNRAYYAMHDSAHAALMATGHESPEAIIKTHHGLIAAFSQRLVQSGQVSADLGRSLNRVEDIRLLADYSAQFPPVAEAEWCVERAAEFVAAIKAKFG